MGDINAGNISQIVTGIISAVIAALIMGWRISESINKKFNDFSEKINNKFNDLNGRVSRIEGLLEATGFSGRTPSPVVQSESPLRLTELGQSVSDALDATAWAQKTAEKVSAEISDPVPFVVQIYCFDFVKKPERLTEPLIRKMQEVAYNKGLVLVQVEQVLAIELRNALLEIYGLEPPPSTPS